MSGVEIGRRALLSRGCHRELLVVWYSRSSYAQLVLKWRASSSLALTAFGWLVNKLVRKCPTVAYRGVAELVDAKDVR
jgi:hypothetical protein